MSTDHAYFAEWDAAYVLGALSSADRRAFEEHLDSCDRCARAIAEIAPALGLLSRVDASRAEQMLEDPVLDETRPIEMAGRASLLARAARDRRRRRTRWTAALAAAAAIVVAVAVALTGVLAPARTDVLAADLVAADDLPIAASVELASVEWGTRIELECTYDGAGRADASGGVPYVLVVTDRSGTETTVSTWRALPGETARLSAATALDVDEIATVDIRLVDGDRVLMSAEFAGG